MLRIGFIDVLLSEKGSFIYRFLGSNRAGISPVNGTVNNKPRHSGVRGEVAVHLCKDAFVAPLPNHL
jgi:hypothetical protein